jgi:hypothetical protein
MLRRIARARTTPERLRSRGMVSSATCKPESVEDRLARRSDGCGNASGKNQGQQFYHIAALNQARKQYSYNSGIGHPHTEMRRKRAGRCSPKLSRPGGSVARRRHHAAATRPQRLPPRFFLLTNTLIPIQSVDSDALNPESENTFKEV